MKSQETPGRAPDLDVDEFERAEPRQAVKASHVGAILVVALLALILFLVVFGHRSTPCHLTVTDLGKGATYEACAER